MKGARNGLKTRPGDPVNVELQQAKMLIARQELVRLHFMKIASLPCTLNYYAAEVHLVHLVHHADRQTSGVFLRKPKRFSTSTSHGTESVSN